MQIHFPQITPSVSTFSPLLYILPFFGIFAYYLPLDQNTNVYAMAFTLSLAITQGALISRVKTQLTGVHLILSNGIGYGLCQALFSFFNVPASSAILACIVLWALIAPLVAINLQFIPTNYPHKHPNLLKVAELAVIYVGMVFFGIGMHYFAP